MPRRVAFVLVWLALVPEIRDRIFDGKWETPLTWVGTEIFNPSFVMLPFWDMAVLATLAWALLQRKARKDRVRPVITSITVSLGSIGAIWAWGVMRGGDVRQTMWQLHTFVMTFVVAHLLIATCRTLEHFRMLGRVIASAAIYRAFVLLYFYEFIVKTWAQRPQTLTSHADSALFVSGLLVLGAWAVEKRSQRAIAWALGAAVPIGLAIHFNNRRLAWLALLVSIGVAYLLLPRGRLKRRLNLALFAAAPFVLFYVWYGWGKTTGIFKPVTSIATMLGQTADASSETRDIENYNLIQTLKSSPWLGLGFGHEYKELSVAYSIKESFEQYRFIPHNSVLGLFAFAGMLGFAGIWQVFVVATFFLARCYRAAKEPLVRAGALAAILGTVVFVLQMWGDMGMVTLPAEVLVAACIASAARLPALSGVWGVSQSRNGVEDERDVQSAEDPKRDEGPTEAPLGALVPGEENRNRESHREDAQG